MGAGGCIERTTFAQAARKSLSGFPLERNGRKMANATTCPSWVVERVAPSADVSPSYSHPPGTTKETSPRDCTCAGALPAQRKTLNRTAKRHIEVLRKCIIA